MEISIFVAVYLLSVFLVWKFINKAYGPKGRWEGLNSSGSDLVFTLMPVLNTSYAIAFWLFTDWRDDKYSKETNFNKFFKIK